MTTQLSSAVIPILLYHSISNDPSPYTRAFAVTPRVFCSHLDSIVASGRTPLHVSSLADGLRGDAPLPERPVVITFDDGFADFAEVALEALLDRGLTATLYVTTGFLGGRPKLAVMPPHRSRMLSWSDLPEIRSRGIEIGGHSHSHRHLDTLRRPTAWRELVDCKRLLEDELEAPVLSFAYPHGYSSRGVRELVREAGYRSACGVKNSLSSATDDPFALARLTVRSDTSLEQLRAWVHGMGAPKASRHETLATRAWRMYRLVRARAARDEATSRA